MLSQSEASRLIEESAQELQHLSYKELVRLATRGDRAHCTIHRKLEALGETVYVNTTIERLGRFRKRLCVEMVLSAEGGAKWPVTPCVYFERFESGRLYVARAKGWEIAIFKALPYVFVTGVAFVVVTLLWYLFLRPG